MTRKQVNQPVAFGKYANVKPVARPVDTYIRPSTPTLGGPPVVNKDLEQLANSLLGANQAVTALGKAKAEQETAEQKALGKKLFLQNGTAFNDLANKLEKDAKALQESGNTEAAQAKFAEAEKVRRENPHLKYGYSEAFLHSQGFAFNSYIA